MNTINKNDHFARAVDFYKEYRSVYDLSQETLLQLALEHVFTLKKVGHVPRVRGLRCGLNAFRKHRADVNLVEIFAVRAAIASGITAADEAAI